MNNEFLRLDRLGLADLKPAVMECQRLEGESAESAAGLIGVAVSLSDAQWAGIAYSTLGSVSVARVDETGIYPLTGDNSSSPIDLDTVYELRLWQTNCPDSGQDNAEAGGARHLLARELRWLNRGGAVQISLRKSDERDVTADTTHYYRKNIYLQHGHGLDGSYMNTMEVFGVGDYGNTIILDELMTGRWG